MRHQVKPSATELNAIFYKLRKKRVSVSEHKRDV